MIYAIVNGHSDKIINLKKVSTRYSLREDFDYSESFAKVLLNEVRDKIGTDNVPDNLKAAIGLNTIVSKVSRNDLCISASLDDSKKIGGIRLISVPDLQMEDHLLIWSKSYGVMAMSREPFSPDVEKLSGQFFILFECMAPFVIGVQSEEDFGFSIIGELSDRDYAESQSRILGDFATYVFPDWEKHHKENGVEKKTEFCFLAKNSGIEC